MSEMAPAVCHGVVVEGDSCVLYVKCNTSSFRVVV